MKPNIRAIMVQNMITKLFELTLQQEMQKEWKRLEILSKKQRGGIGQRSVYDNLLDVFIHIDHAKKQQEAYRREKKKVDEREKTFIVCFDFKKAYDNLNRQLLIKKMLNYGINPKLVSVAKKLLTGTKMEINGVKYETEKGTPQGSTLSPDNWNLYCADLAKDLETIKQLEPKKKVGDQHENVDKILPLFFVDDLAIVVRGEKALEETYQRVKKWADENYVPINVAKSAVMIAKVDRRTPDPTNWNFHGIPLKQEYKYLGFNLTPQLGVDVSIQVKNDMDRKLRANEWLLTSPKLDGPARFHIWQTLFRSRVNYSINIASIFNKKIAKWYKGFTYRACLKLLNVKGKPEKERTLRLCLGQSFEEYLESEQQNSIAHICNSALEYKEPERIQIIEQALKEKGIQMPEKEARLVRGAASKHKGYKRIKINLPIKTLLKKELTGSQIKWRLGIAFNTGLRELKQSKCTCQEEKTISQKHLKECPLYKTIWEKKAKE